MVSNFAYRVRGHGGMSARQSASSTAPAAAMATALRPMLMIARTRMASCIGSGDFQDDLADMTAAFHPGMGVCGIGQRIFAIHHRGHLARLQ